MKKIKSMLCIAFLTMTIVGNVFATSTFDSALTKFLGGIVEVFSLSFGITSDDCPLKSCQDCKPQDPGCRPPGK